MSCGEILRRVREVQPLIHCITNYVTANDCANILLACGGAALMADAPEEAAEMTERCSGLVINTGTLSTARAEAMLSAGRRANELGHPAVLDPVGMGASKMRIDTVNRLLNSVRFSVIKGNASEITAVACGSGGVRGVEADPADAVTYRQALELSERTGAVVVITGAEDIVAAGGRAYSVSNGHPMMSRITGAGCQLSALTAAFVTAYPQDVLTAALAAVCTMGVCGEMAYEALAENEGNAAYRARLIDAVYRITPEMLDERARIMIRN